MTITRHAFRGEVNMPRLFDLVRGPARRAYESVGFQQVHTVRCKSKWVSQPYKSKI